MYTIVIVHDELRSETKAILERYKHYFSKIFFHSNITIVEAIKLHESVLKRQEAFIIIDDNYKSLTDKQWRNIILQSVLNTPIIFVNACKLDTSIVYKHKLKHDLREIFENPEFLMPIGIYILNHEIFRYLKDTIESSIRAWSINKQTKRRGSKTSNNILVHVIPRI